MSSAGRRSPAFRFGVFELDAGSGELRKHGVRIKLQEQPRQILQLLLEHAPEVVTREQIEKQIWPDKTFVDFDNAINSAVRKLREALGDRAENPRFIETLSRRGYRFVAPVSTDAETAPQPATPPPAAVVRPTRRLIGGVAIVLVACGAASLIWLTRRNIVKESAEVRATTLTANAGIELQPSFSPDGTRVVYAEGGADAKNFSIYVKLIGPGDPVRITKDPARDFSPAWSPDGRWIAVLRDLGREAAILLIPASGGQYRELARVIKAPPGIEDCPPVPVICGIDYSGSMLAWSADSKFLFTSGRTALGSALAIVRISVETGDQQTVTSRDRGYGAGDSGPAVSPDGRALAFVRSESVGKSDLYVAPLSGDTPTAGEPRRITSDNADLRTPAWTANGQELIFSSNRRGRRDLWRVSASAPGNPVRVAGVGENATDVAISPRGLRLVYGRANDYGSLWRFPIETGKPNEPVRVAFTSSRIGSPSFSPDGTQIAFQSGRTDAYEVWLCDADGANMVQLTNFRKGASGSPRWSPDGRTIAFDSNVDGHWDIYVIRADGGRPARVTTNHGNFAPNWSRDGRWIYYTSARGGSEVRKVRPDGTSDTQVMNGGSFAVESADGKYVYYKNAGSDTADLWRMPVGGGLQSKVLEGVRGRVYTVTERGIYFVAGNPALELRFFDFAGKSIRVITPMAGLSQAAVSNDGRWALINRNEFWGTNLLVVENFR